MTLPECIRRLPFLALFLLAVMMSALSAGAQTVPGVPQEETPTTEAKILADMLKDDKMRAALIAQLEGASAEVAKQEAPPPSVTIGRQIAELSRDFASDLAKTAAALRYQIAALPDAFDSLTLAEIDLILSALADLGVVISASVISYLVLRYWLKRMYRRMDERVPDQDLGQTLVMIFIMVLTDIAGVLLAAAVGYVAALAFDSDGSGVGVRQAMYLNAFVVVGLIKVLLRVILSPTTEHHRLISIPTSGAQIMARWFGIIAGVLAYGQLLITPIATKQLGVVAGASFSTTLALVAILIAAFLTLYGRRPVAKWFIGHGGGTGIRAWFCRLWHLPVLIYLVAIFFIVATRPDGVFWPVMSRSAQVLAAVIIGGLVSAVITKSIHRGVVLPHMIRARLPLLEARLNAFVPRLLSLIRLLIVLAVIGFALDSAGLFNTKRWVETGSGGMLLGILISTMVISFFAFMFWVILASWVDYRLNPEFGSIATARERTLLSLMKNAVTVLVVVLTTMFVLSEIGVNIAPLIASAGVFGLAIGFGAQKMVQDIITGIFIQFENAMNVGDVVTLNGTTGTVEKLTIRSVSLRDVEGCFHIIPFSSVDMVSNYMREYGNFVCDMGIAYREDITEAKQAMFDAFDELMEDPAQGPVILDKLQWFGVHMLGDSAVVLRARIKCAPGAQWGVGRVYNEIVKRIFDERGIEIPFPHQTVFFGVDKKGEAPPLHIARNRMKGEGA